MTTRSPATPQSDRASDTSSPPPAARPRRIWINGELVDDSRAVVSVFDHGLLYGDGVFEGLRIYNRRIFKLRTHLTRLYHSAKAVRLAMPYTPRQLERAMRETVEANGRRDGYIRLCVTRGRGTLGLNPFNCERPTVFIIVDAIQLYPQELYDDGMEVVTARTIRNHPQALSPQIKSMNYLNNIMAKIEAIDAGVLEAVMLNHDGNVAECTGDNLFAVRGDGGGATLVTPPLHAGILKGVTRGVVIELARQLSIPVQEVDLSLNELYTADEMFLTGSAAEVIPVTKLDGREIGDGTPGPITSSLIDAFRRLVAEDAPED